ncbi:gas vesicle protein K [Kitasatospora sp. NPDC047058]|uniref:gas vesicle protein K n=1 Tax=Kitasatospora sp. NPDC047058 TaxID=3155620 RepID=UPI0033E56FD0
MNGPPRDRTAGAGPSRPDPASGRRVTLDPETVGRDLASLVLAVVELIRQLMERQALRRIDQGDLSDDQIERIGLTLMALEDRMTELRERFGLTLDDLNIDLGPLGPLLSSD